MQSPHNRPRKGAKFLDVKVFIAAFSVAVTLGLWNLFSNNLVLAEKIVPTPVLTPPPSPSASSAQDLPPLPTLVPLIAVSSPQTNGVSPVNSAQPAGQNTPLRVVSAPTQAIIQKYKPAVNQPNQPAQVANSGGSHSSASNGGGSAAPAPAPVTTTGSSH